MCGIAGFMSFGEPREAGWLQVRVRRMLAALSHRGPDGEGLYLSPDGRVALGHRRLSILDLSMAGHQPMASVDGRSWLAFNGAYFDYQQARQRLAHYPFRSHTDTEVLLALLHEAQEPARILPGLNGMFALAYYDERRHELLLARDHFGIKPLYYSLGPDCLWFASEPAALLASGEVQARLEPEDFALYATVRMEAEGAKSWFAGIEQLEPAHYLRLVPGQAPRGQQRYWLPSLEDTEVSPEQVRQCFMGAVERRQHSEVPRAALLSGGLDSSAIIAALDELGADVLSCIITYEDDHPQIREDVAHARALVEQRGLKAEHVRVRTGHLLPLTREVTRRVQRPSVHGAELGMHLSYRLIRQSGRTVVYSGHGSDETWGYQDGLYFPLMAPTFRPDMHSRHYLQRHLYQEHPQGWYPFLQRHLFPALGVSQARVEELIWERALAAYREPDTLDPHKRARYHMCRRFLVYVNQMVDALSMTFSLEERPVFQDLELVQLSFLTPEYRKNREGPTSFKPFLKRALAPLLPEAILMRPKVGFQPPVHERLRQSCLEELRSGLPFGLHIPREELEAMPFTQLFFLLSTREWLAEHRPA